MITFINGLVSLALFFTAVIVHEFSHAFVAHRLGDDTAKKSGRLTLNPLVHIDLFGTIILPLFLLLTRSPFLFGWAKPVPVSFAGLHNPKRDMIWVGLAGPVSNVIFALLLAFVVLAAADFPGVSVVAFKMMIFNLVLGVFNMIPVPPLDGSRVLAGLLPQRAAMGLFSLERYGMLIVFILVLAGVFDEVIWPVVEWLAMVLLYAAKGVLP